MRYYSAYAHTDYELYKNDLQQAKLQVNSTGSYWFDERSSQLTHRKDGRPDYLLIYVQEGRSKMRLGRKNYLLEAGNFFLYRPFQEQYYGQIEREPLWCYWVHFSGNSVLELLEKLGFSDRCVIHTGVSQALMHIFEEMGRTVSEKEEYFEILASSLLVQLLYGMARRANERKLIRKKTDTVCLVQDTVNDMYRTYHQTFEIEELAKQCGICAGRYIHIFKELTGDTPKHYITSIRMEKACELLKNTSMSVMEISYAVGYVDSLYFSRLFKKYIGSAPVQYRKQTVNWQSDV